MTDPVNRRNFFVTASSAAAAAGAAGYLAPPALATETAVEAVPAAAKANVRWPIWDEAEQNGLLDVLNSGKWGRTSGARKLPEFEALFAKRMQARFCLATSSGTTALLTTLGALGIGPGDEVIIPPYTFVATFNAVTMNYALPVFVDTDAETFQIDPSKIEAAISDDTRLIMPVHIGGSPADLDAIDAIAKAKSIPMIEDACQAPLAEWRGKPVGTVGLAGCFSFQASKNITSGDGGAVLTNDELFAHKCYNFHTPGGGKPAPSLGRGANFRLTEFQAALLLAQYSRLEKQSQTRDANAAYLTELLSAIPGISPAKKSAGFTRSGWHLFMWRYDKNHFGGMSRANFLKALSAAGVAASGGYSSLDRSPHVKALADNLHYQRIYGKTRMTQWRETTSCPVNDRLCEEAVWLTQTQLLGTRSDMERIAEAVAKIQRH